MADADAAATPVTLTARVWSAAARAGEAVAAVARAVPWQPWSVLGPLVLVQWAAVAAFALTVRHNGWLFYQGGDETWYYTSAWSIANGHLPVTPVGWGWSLLLSPIALFAGPSYLSALPAIVLVQALVFLPLGLVSLYSIGARLGGRLLGYATAAAWIAAPFALILGTDPRYHERYVEQFLPQLLGLTGLADFVSMTLLIVATALLLRALDTRGHSDAMLAGAVASFAIGVKPSNAIFLIAVAALFLGTRRLKDGLLFAIALVPGLLVLAVWKYRGIGQIPAFALDPQLLALGAGGLPRPSELPAVVGAVHVNIDWNQLDRNLVSLREFFWNTRLFHVLPFVGLAALFRRSAGPALLVGVWFAAYFVLKGSNAYSTVESGSFFRFLMPALPAFLLLVAAIPLLVPVVGGRMAATGRAIRSRPTAARASSRSLLVVLAVTGLIPLLLFAVIPHLTPKTAVDFHDLGVYVPLRGSLRPEAHVTGGKVDLTWRAESTGNAKSFYRLVRWDRQPLVHVESGGTQDWSYLVPPVVVATPRDARATDEPGPGQWWYAVGWSANWIDDVTKGDVLLMSPPVPVDVP